VKQRNFNENQVTPKLRKLLPPGKKCAAKACIRTGTESRLVKKPNCCVSQYFRKVFFTESHFISTAPNALMQSRRAIFPNCN